MPPPNVAVGLDGCPRGWVAAVLQGGCLSVEYWENLSPLGTMDCLAMVDMPIGLPDLGYRRCDVEARALLKRSRSRVFLGARRPLLAYSEYPAANAWGKSVGCGVSRQVFAIRYKLQEVDEAVAILGPGKLKETHPELAFLRLNGFEPLPNKRTAAGATIRREILKREGLQDIDRWLQDRKLRAKPDDVLDACVAALAARDCMHKVPEIPEADAKGLAMEIWY
jgi:predicted RNase H-like nuclease